MNSLLKGVLGGIKNIHHHINQLLQSQVQNTKNKIDDVVNSIHTDQNNGEVHEKNSKHLDAYSMVFAGQKIIILGYKNSQEIYKIFPHEGGNFITGGSFQQIKALYQNHRRTFCKKIKNTPKFKQHIKNIFLSQNKISQVSQSISKNIETTLSPAEKILQKKQEKNKKSAKRNKQNQTSQIHKKRQEQQKESISDDYEILFGNSHILSKICIWNTKKVDILSPKEAKEKQLQIQAASNVYKILLAKVENTVFEETKNIPSQKRFKILKSKIKKYLNEDFGKDPEVQNKQRHLHHLVNSSCDILVDSVSHKKQKSHWTDYYSQAA